MSEAKIAFKRILSAVIALPVYVFGFSTDLFYSIPVLIISTVISLICLYEYYLITYKDEEHKPFISYGLIAGAAINMIMYLHAYGGIRYIRNFDSRAIFTVIVLLLSTILINQIFKRPIKGSIYSVAVTVFGVIYIVLFFSHIILIKRLSNGFCYILILNIVVMLNDTGAYFGGMLFGKHKTNLTASPNKSWEGYFSGLLIGVLSMIITNQVFQVFYGIILFDTVEALFVGIALSVLGNIGDLIESTIKRDGAIKDSGSIIPGHGGMWDAFDALIFTLPLFYYYLLFRGS